MQLFFSFSRRATRTIIIMFYSQLDECTERDGTGTGFSPQPKLYGMEIVPFQFRIFVHFCFFLLASILVIFEQFVCIIVNSARRITNSSITVVKWPTSHRQMMWLVLHLIQMVVICVARAIILM